MYVHTHLGQDEVEWVKLVTFLKRRKIVQDRARQGESNGSKILTSLTELIAKIMCMLKM